MVDGDRVVDGGRFPQVTTNLEAPGAQRLEHFPLRRECRTVDGHHFISEDDEGALRRRAGVELSERAGGRVSRVGEGRPVLFGEARVEALELV